MPSAPPKKVFCSHRSTDKPAVEDFARRLRKRGIDAWFDGWEIQPGDDLVARINQGLAEADVGLVFFSRATAGSSWVSAEVSALIYRMITEGKPIIPVMIEADAEVPALLRPRARRGIEELDAVVDAILGRSVKPPLGPSPSATRVTRFCLRLEGAMTSPLDLRAELDGQEIVHLPAVVFPPTLRLSFAEFLSGRLKAPRGPAEAAVASLEASLGRLGSELGGVLFSGAIGEALSGLLGHGQAGEILEVVFEASDPMVLSLPFEACRLASRRYPAGQPIALYPEVVVLRRPTSLEKVPPPPSLSLPGPLKILVAVGAPDEGKTEQSVLDLEAELQGILDAVERASQLGNAQVRILEVGHPEEIRKALAADAYHVLHLSGHGGPGVMELEDEDGGPVVVTAQALAAKIHEAGHPLPLVFLSSCHGGTAASGRDRSDTTSFAQDLLQAGLPLVVAMQSRVTDAYASELAASFYAELGRGEKPLASRALAQARKSLEERRRAELAAGAASAEESQPEYATATLFVARSEAPLLDPSRDQEPLRMRPIHRVWGPLPDLRVGDLVGRRQELRETLQVLRDDPRALRRLGRRGGVQLLGMGGVGKSSIAGRAMVRLAGEGWSVVPWSGAFQPGEIARSVGEALRNSGRSELEAAARELSDRELDDETRWRRLTGLLATERLLLVLDNFETNLSKGGGAYLDEVVELQVGELCRAARTGKILVTSRYPLPGREAELHPLHVGPLSMAQTRKLAWRLPALADLREKHARELATALRRIGGHPRMLEYLDGLLRRGQGQFSHVTDRLGDLANRVGVDLDLAPETVDEAAREALLLGAEDILLDELLEQVEAGGDLEVLLQAAISNLPLDLEGLARALWGVETTPDPGKLRGLRESVNRLYQTTLLTPVPSPESPDDLLTWVHRWTAESLAGRQEEEAYRDRCRRMGNYRLWRVRNISHSISDGMEALTNLLAGQAFDRAAEETLEIAGALTRTRQLASLKLPAAFRP